MMNFGIYIDYLTPSGASQTTFQATLLSALSEIESDHRFYIFTHSDVKEYNQAGNRLTYVQIPQPAKGKLLFQRILRKIALLWVRIWQFLTLESVANWMVKFTTIDPPQDKVLKDLNIRMIWFLTGHGIDVQIPYMYTVWDMNNLVHPHFPEFSYARFPFFESVAVTRKRLMKASYMVTGTEVGKKDIQLYFNIAPEKIRVIPFATPQFALDYADNPVLPSREFQEKLPEEYILFPARFWPHKNHVTIVLALGILKREHGIALPVIFTGKDEGNKEWVMQVAAEQGVADQIIHLGLVSYDELGYLYQQALALTFVSMVGPDNLPPLEAFAIGCPAICAHVPGSEEQFEDAALLFEPTDERELANAILSLKENEDLRNSYIEKGKRRARKWKSKDYLADIIVIYDDFARIGRSWGRNDVKIT